MVESQRQAKNEMRSKIKMDLFKNTPAVGTRPIEREGKKDLFEETYEEGDILGEGSFGLVKLIIHRATGREYAAKIVTIKDEEDINNVKNEFLNLKQLNHDCIVGVEELSINNEKGKARLVMELVKGDTLTKYIEQGRLTEKDVGCIMTQLLDCIRFMHGKGICHRDLNPNNIMVTEGFRIKLIDFSVSKFNYGGEMMTATGTPCYKAPEIFNGAFTEKTDMWAVGVILYESLTGKKPFPYTKRLDKMQALIQKGFTEIPEKEAALLSDLAKDLVIKLLNTDPEERLGSVKALMHPWCTQWIKNDKKHI